MTTNNLQNLLQAAQQAQNNGHYQEAVKRYQAALEIEPNHPELLASYGSILKRVGQLSKGLEYIQKAALLAPKHPAIQYNYGLALQESGELTKASQLYQNTLKLDSKFSPARTNWAQILMQQGLFTEAEQHLRETLRLEPTFIPGWLSLGKLFGQMSRFQETSAILQHTLELSPNLAEAWVLLGVARHALQKNTEAENAYRRGLALASSPDGWLYYGNLLLEMHRFSEASRALQQATKLAPQKALAWSQRIQCALKSCDWQDFPRLMQGLQQAIAQGDAAPPFEIIGLPLSATEQKNNAQRWCQQRLGDLIVNPPPKPSLVSKDLTRDKLKIAYLSADFRQHATADLLTEVLERHDHKRFEIHAFSIGIDDKSAIRQRLVSACDHFHDAYTEAPIQTAEKIRQANIDILIDINVHTLGNRLLIPALRPAPIQLNYLGFPGTSGAHFYDYLVADPFVVPAEVADSYTEKIAYLPHCYQPSDTKRPIAKPLDRKSYGLPTDAFIFCCFNANWKWLPTIWEVWMNLLQNVPQSILWLLSPDDPEAEPHLKQKAQNSGVSPERIIFAPRLKGPENLARQTLADLFLDTLPYNAHTTANDALYAGLPVLTCVDANFPGRVAASLLKTLDLSEELVVYNLEAYCSRALYWANHPAELANLRQKIQKQKQQTPAFDMIQFANDWETLLTRIYEAIHSGSPL